MQKKNILQSSSHSHITIKQTMFPQTYNPQSLALAVTFHLQSPANTYRTVTTGIATLCFDRKFNDKKENIQMKVTENEFILTELSILSKSSSSKASLSSSSKIEQNEDQDKWSMNNTVMQKKKKYC